MAGVTAKDLAHVAGFKLCAWKTRSDKFNAANAAQPEKKDPMLRGLSQRCVSSRSQAGIGVLYCRTHGLPRCGIYQAKECGCKAAPLLKRYRE